MSSIDQTHMVISGDDGQRLIVIAVDQGCTASEMHPLARSICGPRYRRQIEESAMLDFPPVCRPAPLTPRHNGLSRHYSSWPLGPNSPSKQTACKEVAF